MCGQQTTSILIFFLLAMHSQQTKSVPVGLGWEHILCEHISDTRRQHRSPPLVTALTPSHPMLSSLPNLWLSSPSTQRIAAGGQAWLLLPSSILASLPSSTPVAPPSSTMVGQQPRCIPSNLDAFQPSRDLQLGQYISYFGLSTDQCVWPYPIYLFYFFTDTLWMRFGGVFSTYPYWIYIRYVSSR
jgi:hypothetical protein